LLGVTDSLQIGPFGFQYHTVFFYALSKANVEEDKKHSNNEFEHELLSSLV
jgi:hypothetical protein